MDGSYERAHGSANAETAAPPSPATGSPSVSVHQTTSERVVFTEADNSDGWIATDLAVELSR